jgi:putative ABC transport system permease protein
MSIGILSGLYPAIYQSATKAIDSLKGKSRSIKGRLQFSRVLIATQFLITLFIFTGAIILSKQVNYFLEKDLGFDKSQVLIVTSVPRLFNDEGFQKMESAKQEFLGSSKIKDVSLSWGAPGWNFSPFDLDVFRLENSIDAAKIRSSLTSADEDYLDVFDIKLVEGEFLQTAQLEKIVLNRTAQKALSAGIGDQVKFQGDDINVFTVGGVVEDFNYESLHEPIRPIVFMHTRALQMYRFFSFKLEPGSLAESVIEVEKFWKKTFPNDPFDYTFTDEKLKALYNTEVQLKKASSIATTLMIIIVLTGVFGLVSLNVSKRIKEIGIRKVLGASVSNILSLISREYAILMLVAAVVATPLAYLAADYWLNNFAYHIDVKWWIFVIPVGTLFMITILVVCIQSLGTALSNPVKSLRYE